ncbi:MAG: hypothetical protein ABFC96_00305 [Thermoguttaceae bacterium]
MQQPFIPQRLVVVLIATALLLPIAACVVAAVASLMWGMGDRSGGAVLLRVAQAGGILWIIDLVCLLLTTATATLHGPDRRDEP